MKSPRSETVSITFAHVLPARPAVSGPRITPRPRRRIPDYPVLLSIRVDTGNLAAARRMLHDALGPALSIYTAEINRQTGRACLQIELAKSLVSQVMSSIIRLLPEAELGAIRPSRR
ncbi:hypothetical protein [Burkholderia ubonensis]|uniref:hypothetical protein n=1 Tax=Burkholderia ubonensis TaxID=101571 RepID=UPI000A5B45C5|nr:hypothetical protein [Burkholderia ubonensis]